MIEDLHIPPHQDGQLWLHSCSGAERTSHCHVELEFNLVVRGTCSYLIQDRKYTLRRDTLLWLFPSQDHVLLDESDDHVMWIGVFRGELLKRCCTSDETRTLLETDPGHGFCRQLTHSHSDYLSSLFDRLHAQNSHVDLYNSALAFGLLSLWQAFCDTDGESASSPIHPAVEKAIYLIRDESDQLNIEELARQCGMSASRLSYLFKSQTGLTLVDFRNSQRLSRFLSAYGKSPTKTMIDAALEAGFGSYPQFHRIFRRAMGCGPAEYWRDRYRGASVI